MKNLITYLSKKSLSRTDRVWTLAIDAVSLPSFCRVNMLKLVSVLVLILTVGVGNVWGAPVTIVSWDGAARTANSQVSPTSSQTDNSSARLKSECALSTAGSGGCAGSYYSTWTNGNCIYLTSLSLSGYTDVSLDISLRRRNGTCTAAFYASTDGSSYAGSAFDTKTLTNSCDNYSVDVASNVKAIKIVIDGGSGNLWLGDVSLSGTAAAATPTITPDPTSLDWGTVLQGSSQSTKTISITGANLTAGTLTISATGGYSVTPTSKSVSGTLAATTLTVTPPSTATTGAKNGKVTISGGGLASNVEVNLSMTVNAASTVTWMNNGSEYTTTLVANGSKPEFPSNPISCDATSDTFYGWSTAEWTGALDDVSAKTIYTDASAMPAVTGAVTYYAVFAKAVKSDNFQLLTDANNFISGEDYLIESYYSSTDHVLKAANYSGRSYQQTSENSWSLPSSGVNFDMSSKSALCIWKITSEGNNRFSIYNASANKYLVLVTVSTYDNLILSATKDASFVRTVVKEEGYADTYKFESSAVSGKHLYCEGAYWDAYTSAEEVNLYKRVTTYSKYLTNCCTELGSINGSVSWSNAATAVVSWDNLDHVSSWTVKYKTHAAGAYTTWAGEQSTAAGRRSVTITGLAPCTNYDFQIIANPASGYCEKDQTIEDSQTHNWTVTSTGVTHATASPAIPSTTCSGFSTTISAATGYALPAEITVTNASKTWNSSTGALTISSVTGNVSITITPTCVSPVVTADPADADYYVGDDPTALSVTATLASGTLTYLWKVSTNGGSTWSNASGTNNAATYSGASLSTASAGTIKFKCIVGNSQGGCTVESGVATITVSNASYFPNGKTIFIQAESTSAWTGGGCVKAWFHTAGGSETAQSTYWLFDATGGDAGKKLFATVVPASGDLPYLDIQRFASNCSDWWNKNGGCSYADASGSNAIRSTGKHDTDSDGDYVRWNGSGVTIDLHGDPSGDEWASSLASFSDQGAGVWTATYSNYAPADAEGESQDFKAKTNYNGWIGNTGSNNNATLDGMHVGSTYNITATLDVTDHSLVMSKEFVKGTVHFDLQGHGLAISDLTNVAAGSKISAPSEPSATGYTFGGWFKEPACTNEWTFASDVVEETMTLYAKWTTNVYTITKTLTNVANEGLPSSFTYTGAATTALNSTFTVNTTNFFLPSSITVTMGGATLTAGTDYTYNNSTGAFTFSKVINGNIVITASATPKLLSIAITTQPTTRKYFAGESFSSTGAVVTATMGNGTKTVTATWTPSGALSAGTSQTVTASYTENGITKTATTTIDVYSVTVNKVNEDGDAVSADGVTATWTVGTKALAASASDASKYVFKQWEVTGATAASTSSANTTLSSPTANVVVNAVFYKPRVVKWSVNGNDSYNTGSPTTTVAYNGTISTIPTAPSGLVCASTFVAWTDAAHNNGTTAKASTSYYESKLFTAANQFPNITAETTTFYAVFAEGTGAAVNTVMWSEDWTGYADNAAPSSPNTGDGYGAVVYGGASIGYAWAAGTGSSSGSSKVTTGNGGNLAGGSSPEAMIGKTGTGSSPKGGKLTISGILPGGADSLTLTYKQNAQGMTVSIDGTGYYLWNGSSNVSSISHNAKNTFTHPIVCGSASTFSLTFQANGNNNVRLDDIEVKVRTVTLTNYVTECDGNIVSVTYDANGGSTSCTNTTTDKTEDFTVCSTPPTRDYYTFAGWLCSADSKTYAANATISAAAIDADFTLTAQWTPVPYSITYELYGGTNSGSNPATYNVTTATITLQDPTKGHDRFEGWYSTYSAGVYSDQVTSIPLGSHGDITLHAKWAERHEIIFDADGTQTTIYRADDEDLSASVAGQGSVPSDPEAPTACSSKVFVGWSESTIDGETDTEPGDLMKPAAGTVDEDKHYYAVWADEHSESGTVTVFNDAFARVDNGTAYGDKGKISSYYVYGTGTAGEARISSSSNAGYLDIDLSDKTLASSFTITFKLKYWNDTESGTLMLGCEDAGNTASFSPSSVTYPTTSGWKDYSCTVTSVNAATQSVHFQSYSAKRIYIKDIVITQTGTIYSYSAYATSCCATKVTLSQNSPEHGTIAFGKTKVGTCGDKEVSLTITPAAGYQLHTYEVATGSGKVGTKSVSPAISLDNNSSAAQNITLTFADEANGAYDVTAAFSLMTVTSWAWTYNSAAIADPFNLYVGQRARLDVAYTPAGVDASKKTYTRTKDDTYINWVGSVYAGYSTIEGRASTGENTTAVTFTHADGPETVVNVKVLPLPLTHFEDLVHGKAFANVAATIEDNALSATKTTPTSDDWTTPNANPCEENHLHLVGWIREDWPALVNYLNGTGDAPTTTAIVGAGNDGAGHAYYIAAGASINVQTFDGVTFYAVWAEIK